jgi:hypothetical protein
VKSLSREVTRDFIANPLIRSRDQYRLHPR